MDFKLVLKVMLLVSIGLAVVGFGNAQAQSGSTDFRSWAPAPPMGWNSWDCYGPTVTEKEVKANADYMAAHLRESGWQYVVVDIRWYVENTSAHGYNQTAPRYVMDDYGRLLPAANRFPSARDGAGFKPLADYVHSLGLKFGIHVMRGVPVEAVNRHTPIPGSETAASDIYTPEDQCRWLHDMYTVVAGRDGAQSYYNSLFNLYASWGVDYVKVDDLSRPYHAAEIAMIRNAIDQCGRPIVLSMSPGPTPIEKAAHAGQHANLWRISNDFWDRWDDVLAQFDRCRRWAPYGGPGHWPDADMLPLGRIGIRAERGDPRMTRLTHNEQITLMTLWSIFRSPLMFGGNLPDNDAFTVSLLTNKEVLFVNQHSTGNRELARSRGHVAWVADIPDGSGKYVALFNINDPSANAGATEPGTVSFRDIGLPDRCAVRDLWANKDLGTFSRRYTTGIPFHGAGLYKIVPE